MAVRVSHWSPWSITWPRVWTRWVPRVLAKLRSSFHGRLSCRWYQLVTLWFERGSWSTALPLLRSRPSWRGFTRRTPGQCERLSGPLDAQSSSIPCWKEHRHKDCRYPPSRSWSPCQNQRRLLYVRFSNHRRWFLDIQWLCILTYASQSTQPEGMH